MKRTPFGIVVVALLCRVGASGQSGYELLQQALSKEQAEGKLNEAIVIYQRIAKDFDGDHVLAAKALLRLGEAYRKLGDQKAQQIFESIISKYADQKDAVAEARTRLAGLRTPTAAHAGRASRQVWTGRDVDGSGKVSADGRYLSFTDWTTGDLAVRDLDAGTNRRLTNTGGWDASGDFAELSAVSPDGRQVAYSWFTEKPSVPGRYYELRLLSVGGGASAKPRILQRGDEFEWVWPTDWTPDGANVIVLREHKDRPSQIALVSVADGSVRVLKEFGQGPIPGRVSASPDGRYLAYDLALGHALASRDIHLLPMDGSAESVVVQGASNDFRPLWAPDGTLLFLSDRTGRDALWALRIEAGKPQGRPELLSSDIQRSVLGMTRRGSLYYMTGGGKRNVYVAELDQQLNLKGTRELLTERFLNFNGPAVWSPDGQQVAYYSSRGSMGMPGAATVVLRTVKTGDERDIPLKGLVLPANAGTGLKWFADGRSLLVASRPPERDGTEYYKIDASSGNLELLHRTRGRGGAGSQADISPDGSTLFYIERAGDESSRLVRLDLRTRRETELKTGWFYSLSLSPDGAQLAYLGNTVGDSSRSNQLTVIPATGGEGRVLFEGKSWFDHTRYGTLGWSHDQRHVLFVTGERTAGPEVLWRVPIGGGAPVKTGLSLTGRIKSPRVHPDGARLLVTVAEEAPGEVWVLENFLPAQRAR